MNNSSLNDLPDFVIKSSSTILRIALEMDQVGDKNALQEEDASLMDLTAGVLVTFH